MKNFIIILILSVFSLGFMLSCKSKPFENPDSNVVIESIIDENEKIKANINESQESIGKETNTISEQIKIIEENVDVIGSNSNSLEENFQTLQSLVPELMALTNNDQKIMDLIHKSLGTIKSSSETIDKSNETIKNSNEAIKLEREELKNATKDIASQQQKAERLQNDIGQKDKIIAEKEKKISELEKTAEQASTKYLGMLIAFGVIIMVLGVLGFFYNAKVGIAMLGIGGITVAVTAATMYYMGWFALIGLITMGAGLLLLIIYLAWALFRGRVFAKATEENAELIETIKQDLPAEKTKEIFGDRIKPGIAQVLQSPSTKKEIDKIRRNILKPKMENTIKKPINPNDILIIDGIVYQKTSHNAELKEKTENN